MSRVETQKKIPPLFAVGTGKACYGGVVTMVNVMVSGGIASGVGSNSGGYVRRYDLLGERRRLLLGAIEGHRLDRYSITRGSALVGCHVAPIGAAVQVKRYNGGARYSSVETCHNALCPVCGGRIMAARSEEIREATHRHMAAGGECYMLTLTIRHSRNDGLATMLTRLDRAWRCYGRSRRVRSALLAVHQGYIRSLEVQYGLDNGFHPHYHILFFTPSGWVLDDATLDALRSEWVASCRRSGLDASYGVGCNIERVERVGQYLTKIGAEMALAQNKSGRDAGGGFDVQHGHFSHLQLLELSRLGYSWAGAAAVQEIAVLRGRHLLHWSVGLKARLGIAEKTDDEICEESGEGEALAGLVQNKAWRCLPWGARGAMLDIVRAAGVLALPIAQYNGHKFYLRDYGGVPMVVVE